MGSTCMMLSFFPLTRFNPCSGCQALFWYSFRLPRPSPESIFPAPRLRLFLPAPLALSETPARSIPISACPPLLSAQTPRPDNSLSAIGLGTDPRPRVPVGPFLPPSAADKPVSSGEGHNHPSQEGRISRNPNRLNLKAIIFLYRVSIDSSRI